jgi:hypothetical protein
MFTSYRFKMMQRRVVLLGVGGVGKTTLVYRLMGLSAVPHATLRPGLYRLYFINGAVEVLDVPGQHVTEVARHAARQMHHFFDRAVLMYDLTRPETLYALGEILESICTFGGGFQRSAALVALEGLHGPSTSRTLKVLQPLLCGGGLVAALL